MTKRKKKMTLILLGIVALVLAVAVGITGWALTQNIGSDEYEKQIQLAQHCLENEDYDGAISAYYAAIDLDEKNEVAYLGLADVYQRTGQLNFLNYILSAGYEKTGSKEINDRLDYLEEQAPDSKGEVELAQLNESSLKAMLRAKYSDMQADYNPGNGSAGQEITSVRGGRMVSDASIRVYFPRSGVSVYFTNSPKSDSVPVEIQLDDLRTVFYTQSVKLTYPELVGMNLTELKLVRLASVGPAISFRYMGCTVYIACDEDGTISQWNAWNCILPDRTEDQKQEEEPAEVYILQGKINSATNGQGVSNAVITLYNEDGSVQGEYDCEEDGSYRIEDLPEGNYELSISAPGYLEEQESLYLDSWIDEEDQEFVISPVLEAGQIRIVLTWGALPYDLDSHYSNGSACCHWASPVLRDGNGVIAELDVDDINGNGPETITVYNTKGYFHYMVHDFTNSRGIGTSGAQVKIYRDDGSDPIVLDANPEAGNVWDVFEIRDGEINIIDQPTDELW